jgi:ABC-type protease/lipase transport system fused ATPase/permease subunit
MSDGPQAFTTITDGTFGWTGDKMSVRNINAPISTGQLTMVIGPVTSGKSTLCYALCGEIPHASEEVTIHNAQPEGIGLCEQAPFLLNASLKENFVGFSAFKQAKYDGIIEATRLSLDISLMPSGHGTKIGKNDIMLSGGRSNPSLLHERRYISNQTSQFLMVSSTG